MDNRSVSRFDFTFRKGTEVAVEFKHSSGRYPRAGRDRKCIVCKSVVSPTESEIPYLNIEVMTITNLNGMFLIDLASKEGKAIISRVKRLENKVVCMEDPCSDADWEEDILS